METQNSTESTDVLSEKNENFFMSMKQSNDHEIFIDGDHECFQSNAKIVNCTNKDEMFGYVSRRRVEEYFGKRDEYVYDFINRYMNNLCNVYNYNVSECSDAYKEEIPTVLEAVESCVLNGDNPFVHSYSMISGYVIPWALVFVENFLIMKREIISFDKAIGIYDPSSDLIEYIGERELPARDFLPTAYFDRYFSKKVGLPYANDLYFDFSTLAGYVSNFSYHAIRTRITYSTMMNCRDGVFDFATGKVYNGHNGKFIFDYIMPFGTSVARAMYERIKRIVEEDEEMYSFERVCDTVRDIYEEASSSTITKRIYAPNTFKAIIGDINSDPEFIPELIIDEILSCSGIKEYDD